MNIEYKVSPQHIEDHGDGTVTAYVSVTGIEDNVKDVIEPGAYTRTLNKRIPKGVWSHDWKLPISRTIEAVELPPGHADLPKTLSDGSPWPAGAGAVKVKTEFNTASKRGLQAYQDVKFFGDQQEWSIGYKVPEGGATIDKKTGVRHIHDLDWFEYSPVLFGAMTHARSAKSDPSVAQAQLAYKALGGVDVTEIFAELKKWREEHGYGADITETKDALEFKGDGEPDYEDEEDEDYGDDEYREDDDPDAIGNDEYYEEDDEEDEGDYGPDADMKVDNEYEDEDDGGYEDEDVEEEDTEEDDDTEEKLDIGAIAYVEGKATNYDTVTDAIEHIDVPMSKTDASALMSASIAFDDAIASQDKGAAEQAATELLDVLEMLAEGSDDGKSIAVAARCIADKMAELDPEPENDKGEIEYTEADAEGKSFYYTDNSIEVKNVVYGGRSYGFPLETTTLVRVTGVDGVKSYLGGLGTDTLSAVVLYTETDNFDDSDFKELVDAEVEYRLSMDDAELKRRLDDNCGPKMTRRRVGGGASRRRIGGASRRRITTKQVKDDLAALDNYDLADLYLEFYGSSDAMKGYLEDEVTYRIESGDREAKNFIGSIDSAMEFKRIVRNMSPFWELRGYRVGDTIGHPSGKKPGAAKKPSAAKKGGGAAGAAKKAAGSTKKAGAVKKAAGAKKPGSAPPRSYGRLYEGIFRSGASNRSRLRELSDEDFEGVRSYHHGRRTRTDRAPSGNPESFRTMGRAIADESARRRKAAEKPSGGGKSKPSGGASSRARAGAELIANRGTVMRKPEYQGYDVVEDSRTRKWGVLDENGHLVRIGSMSRFGSWRDTEEALLGWLEGQAEDERRREFAPTGGAARKRKDDSAGVESKSDNTEVISTTELKDLESFLGSLK